MHRNFIAAAAIVLAPTSVMAVTANPLSNNNLSAGDYTFVIPTPGVDFTPGVDGVFTFVADDAARRVTATLLGYSDANDGATPPGPDMVVTINGVTASVGTPVEFDLPQGSSFDFSYALPAGVGEIKAISTSFEVNSAVVPLPAGFPLILAGVGALGLVARKKRRDA